MNSIKITLAMGCIMAFFSAMVSVNVNANEIVIAKSVDKRVGTAISLDVFSDGNASGFQFSIPVDHKIRSVSKSLDLSKCLVDLPKTYTGQCTYRPKSNDVLVVAFSVSGVPLPKGMVGLGVISGPGLITESAKPVEVVFASPLGEAL